MLVHHIYGFDKLSNIKLGYYYFVGNQLQTPGAAVTGMALLNENGFEFWTLFSSAKGLIQHQKEQQRTTSVDQ